MCPYSTGLIEMRSCRWRGKAHINWGSFGMSAAGIGLVDGFSFFDLFYTTEINTGRLLAYSAFLCQGFLGDLYTG
jgi:hypothetical protein